MLDVLSVLEGALQVSALVGFGITRLSRTAAERLCVPRCLRFLAYAMGLDHITFDATPLRSSHFLLLTNMAPNA